MSDAEWRSDEADEASFDAGFEAFVKGRKLPLYKKGEWPQELAEKSEKRAERIEKLYK